MSVVIVLLFISDHVNLNVVFLPLIYLNKGLSIWLIFSKNQLFGSLILYIVLYFIDFDPEFDYFLLSTLWVCLLLLVLDGQQQTLLDGHCDCSDLTALLPAMLKILEPE